MGFIPPGAAPYPGSMSSQLSGERECWGVHGFTGGNEGQGDKRSNGESKEAAVGECGILENEQQSKLCARGHWRPAEDAKLKELVSQFGPQNWNMIAEKLVGRSGKSCRLRWFNQLDPRINRKAFSEEEEERLLAAHRLYGNKWALIARLFPGRTDNAVKNHWHVIMARKQREQSNAYRRRKPSSLPSYNSPPPSQPLPKRMDQVSTSNKACSGDSTISSTRDESASTGTDLSLNSFTSRVVPGFYHLCSPSHQQHSIDMLSRSHENVVAARNGFHEKFGGPDGNFFPVGAPVMSDSISENPAVDPVAYRMNHALPHGETNHGREDETRLPFFDFLGVGAR